MAYAPKFLIEELGDAITTQLEEYFCRITAGLYYDNGFARMKRDGYNPVIIGNSHNFYWNFPKLITSAFGGNLPERLKVGVEMAPQQLGWYRDYLRDVKEYKNNGTIQGEIPAKELVEKLQSYRHSLSGSNNGYLDCIDVGMDILPLEHPDFQKWIIHDRANPLVEDGEEWSGMGWGNIQPAFTTISREIYSHNVIERERPDVIIVGYYHALKFDLLMGRDGSRTWIYSMQRFRWPATMQMWYEVHELYRKHKVCW